jgi:hypothetical protein
MLITLDDNELLEDLCSHFQRSGFAVERVGGAMVQIERADAPSRDQSNREVLMHLRIWEILNRRHAAISCT